MNILLLGGTGTLSTTIMNLCLEKKYNVSIFNRGRRNELVPSSVEILKGDFTDYASLKEKLSEKTFDVVVDFLSRIPSDIERVYPLLGNSCSQYIFISTACVYERNPGDMPLTEKSPMPNKLWSYNVEKYQCEQKLSQLSSKFKSYYTIVRPYITYDHERIPFGVAPAYKFHRTIIERIKNGKPMFIWGDGKTPTTSTNVKEFAVGVVGLFMNPKAQNEDFHITSTKYYDSINVLNLLFERLGCKPNIVTIPVDKCANFLPNYREMILGDRSLPAIFDNSKILDAVPELKFTIDVKEGIDEVVNYYENLDTFAYDYIYDAQIDRLLSNEGQSCKYVSYKGTQLNHELEYKLFRYLPYRIARRIYRITKIFK